MHMLKIKIKAIGSIKMPILYSFQKITILGLYFILFAIQIID